MTAVDSFTEALRYLVWATAAACVIFVAIGLAASQLDYVKSGKRARYRNETAAMNGRMAQYRNRLH